MSQREAPVTPLLGFSLVPRVSYNGTDCSGCAYNYGLQPTRCTLGKQPDEWGSCPYRQQCSSPFSLGAGISELFRDKGMEQCPRVISQCLGDDLVGGGYVFQKRIISRSVYLSASILFYLKYGREVKDQWLAVQEGLIKYLLSKGGNNVKITDRIDNKAYILKGTCWATRKVYYQRKYRALGESL